MAVKKGNNTSAPVSSGEMLKLIKIVLIIVAISVAFYGITVLVLKYKKNQGSDYVGNSTPAIIQYEEIMLGTLLSQKENEYYVLVMHEDDPYNTLFESYMKTYKAKEGALTVYKANIDSVFNQYYVSDVSNLNVSEVTNFKVSDISLIKVKDKNVVEAYEGFDNIENALKELTKK